MRRQMILIHGAWLASNSWELFEEYFRDQGYDTLAPEWPRKAAEVAEQRAAPKAIEGLGVEAIVDHYARIITALPEPPVLVGHSFGGLFVELLLDRGLGVAGVALDPAPPKGVLRLEASELKAAAPALAHPLHHDGTVGLTLEQFTYAFVNTFSEQDAKEAYARYAVPESARILFQGGLANFTVHAATKLDYARSDLAPLLITAGELDHTVPKGVAHAAWKKYQHSSTQTDFVQFPGRPHLLMAGEGWEEVAAYVADWLQHVLDPAPAPAGVAAPA